MGVFDQLLVVELANVLAGPSVGQFFAELGARVIKVEHPERGDTTRQWLVAGEEPARSGVTAYFSSVNWGKESVGLNLAAAEGQEVLAQLLKKADIVITSFKPGAASRLGADYETVKRINPALIYVSITGFGEDDLRSGFDALVQAETGFLAMNGWPGAPPNKMPVALMDVLAGHQAKEAVLVALLERQQNGVGQFIPISLQDAAVASLVNQGTNWLQAGHDPQPMGNEHPNIVPYGSIFTGRSGRPLMLAIGTDAQFARFCRLLEHEEWVGDPRMATNAKRVQHRDWVRQQLQLVLSDRNLDDLYEACVREGIPVGRVRPVSEALSLPKVQEVLLQDASTQSAGIRTAVFRSRQLSPPPMLGANTETVLHELGFDAQQRQRWRELQIIG